MPELNFYLKPDETLSEDDAAKLYAKAHGKTLTVKVSARQLKGEEVKSNFKPKDEIFDWIKGFGLSAVGKNLLKRKAKFDGKVAKLDDYVLNIAANGKRAKARLYVEPVAGLVVETVEPPAPTYANGKVRSACSGRMFQAKIRSISLAGRSEKGHGPVEFLGGALHAHVTNSESLAWEWKSDKMHIVATGKKNSQNKKQQRGGTGKKLNTCQYDWHES